MLRLRADVKVYVFTEPVDGRKAINGLCALVAEAFCNSLQEGSVYVFYNQNKDKVKCLFWDRNGFVLYHKRLERGKFKFSKHEESSVAIKQEQLDWLLAGLDFMGMQAFSELDYSHYF